MRYSFSVAVALLLAVSIAAARPPRPTPAPTKTPAPAPGGLNSPGEALLQQDEAALTGRTYSYDPAGRRDPFRSLLVRAEDRARGDRPLGVPGMSIDDIAIYGIWKTRSGYIAQVRATDNKSYLIRPGDLLGDTYVAYDPGRGPGPLHGTVGPARTANAPRLDDLLASGSQVMIKQ